MVWGQKRGIDDLVERLLSNDVKLQSLTILSGRTFGEEEASKLFAALASNTVLTELNASGRPLAPRAAAELRRALESNKVLTKLSVGDADTGDEAVQHLAAGLQHNSVLQELVLEKKAFGARGMSALAACLQFRNAEAPLVLKLSGNRLGGAQAAAALGSALQRLQELEIADCGLDAQDLKHLLSGNPGQLGLHTLVLSGNHLSSIYLYRLPVIAPALRSLELRGAHLGAADFELLASALKLADYPPPLQHLGIADNGLGADAGPAVGQMLLACPSLKSLDLRSNPLQDGGIAAICSTLVASGAKPPLAALDLTNCKISASAVRELACMEALEELRLVGNDLSGSGLAPLLDAAAATGAWAALRQLAVAACNLPDLDEHLRALCLTPQPLLPALEMVEVARNPGVDREGFEELVKECSCARPGLHIAWRGGAGEDPAELALHRG